MIKNILFVGVGGFAGSIARYLVYYLIEKRIPSLPAGTFAVNILGSFMLGIFTGIALHHSQESNMWRLIFAVGFCGSFTTFSTFALDNYSLLQDRHFGVAALYAILSVVLGLGAMVGGIWLGRQF